MDTQTPPRAYKARKCGDCDAGALEFIETKQAGVGSERVYECTGCGAKLRVPPAGFIGTYLCVWAIVSLGLVWLFLLGRNYPGPLTYLLVGGFIAIGGFSVFSDLAKHLIFPEIEPGADLTESDLTGSEQKPHVRPGRLTRFWDMGLFKTPLAAILIAVLLLLGAAMIGYVNDTFLSH